MNVNSKPLVIVLLGPTASGKTSLGIELAKHLNLAIHNIDSRQLYEEMNIGTAKPNQDQLKNVVHFLINLRKPNDPITLQEFQKIANKSIQEEILTQGKALLVGGSGLYLKSITAGYLPPEVPPQPKIRKQLNELGQEICYSILQSADQVAAKKISRFDNIRTQRALEVIYATGERISSQQHHKKPPWEILELGLDPKDLRQRIKNRTLKIYENGLITETEILIKRYGVNLPILQTIGYKEAIEVINGKSHLEEAIAMTTLRTQQFAKRQRTWFRRKHDAYWLNDEEPLREALSLIKSGLG